MKSPLRNTARWDKLLKKPLIFQQKNLIPVDPCPPLSLRIILFNKLAAWGETLVTEPGRKGTPS